MKKLILIDIPGFSSRLLPMAPKLNQWAKQNQQAVIEPSLPALTLPAHATLLTGEDCDKHGVVANGWYHRDLNEVNMWPQSEGLVEGEKIWESLKKNKPDFKCFKYFWWPGMNSSADLYGNVRPVYYADGRKGPGLYINRPGLADELQNHFGKFPLFDFWGPRTSIKSTQWILDSASHLMQQEDFDLTMLYLPHLDYKQQSHGPNHACIPQEVADLDDALIKFIQCHEKDHDFLILSTYAITEVDSVVHPNRLLREAGFLQVVDNEAGELIDFGESKAFAVSDHQVANIYIKNQADIPTVKALFANNKNIGQVLDKTEQAQQKLAHANSGELLLFSAPRSWFSYYYWLNDDNAPDFARSVAIHAKPGYDPCEMLVDPTINNPNLKAAITLTKKKLGLRYLMNFTPLDASLIKGSHGLAPEDEQHSPLCLSSSPLKSQIKKIPLGKISQEIINFFAQE